MQSESVSGLLSGLNCSLESLPDVCLPLGYYPSIYGTVEHQHYDGNNGDNTPHIDKVSPATQHLVKG